MSQPPAADLGDISREAAEFRARVAAIHAELSRVIVGQQDLLDLITYAVLSGGHVLLEGVPGLGKTLLVRTLAQTLDLRFSRIQFTPDLMPADIVGTNLVMQDDSGRRRFEFQPGPVFSQIVLADEINRATPKTQSALLEAMQEHAVTVAGESRRLDEPFFVLATQNPIEMEGTYPLPEAQLDRFLFKLRVPFPGLADLQAIIDRTTGPEQPAASRVLDGAAVLEMQALARRVPVATHVREYAARLVMATHPESEAAADAGVDPGGKSARPQPGAVQRGHRGYPGVGLAGVAAPPHPQLRGRGRRRRSG